MKKSIEVTSREEADQIRAGLDMPDVRVFVRVMGVLAGLPSDRARRRVLSYVADRVDEGPEPEPA